MPIRPHLRALVLAVWRFLLRAFAPKHSLPIDAPPGRILLINGAHLGDAVIITSLLPVLKSAYPNADIGVLTASWAHPVVKDHPAVSFTHCVDHWRMNRGSESFLSKRLRYWRMRSRALAEIRLIGYDLSISTHPWRADFLPLAWQARIPARVSFSGGPFAPLATVTADYPEHERFIRQGECQLLLLRALGIADEHLRQRRPSLAPSTRAAIEEVRRILDVPDLGAASYSVIHTGAGSPVREMPASFWREIARGLPPDQPILFTGKGARDSACATEAAKELPNAIDACNRLSWEAFVAAIRYAHAFYGLDSMAAHVAAAVGTRCVAVYAGMNNLARFRPDTENCMVWANALPCSACNRQSGCAEMTCMQGFDPREILALEFSFEAAKARSANAR